MAKRIESINIIEAYEENGNSNGSNGWNMFMEATGLRTMRDLSLDMSNKK